MILQPQILDTHFAVLMAAGKNGHVLNINGEACLSDNSEVYKIYNDLKAARKHIEEVQQNNGAIECVIYNSKFEVTEF